MDATGCPRPGMDGGSLDLVYQKLPILIRLWYNKEMNHKWLYQRLASCYCHDNDRLGTDSVLLIKMVLIGHSFAPSVTPAYPFIPFLGDAGYWMESHTLPQ